MTRGSVAFFLYSLWLSILVGFDLLFLRLLFFFFFPSSTLLPLPFFLFIERERERCESVFLPRISPFRHLSLYTRGRRRRRRRRRREAFRLSGADPHFPSTTSLTSRGRGSRPTSTEGSDYYATSTRGKKSIFFL